MQPRDRRSRNPRCRLCIVALLALLGTSAVQDRPPGAEMKSSASKGRQKVNDVFTEFWNRVPIEVPITPQPIRDREIVPSPVKAGAERSPAVLHSAVNNERNSRIPVLLAWPLTPKSPTSLRWNSPLPHDLKPLALLMSADRLAIQAVGQWALFDLKGQYIAARRLIKSGLALDPERAVLIAGNADGDLDTWRLKDGGREANIRLLKERNMDRRFLGPQYPKLIVTSVETDLDVHAAPVQKSMIEVVDLGGAPGSPAAHPLVLRNLMCETSQLMTALGGDFMAAAAKNCVYILNFDLKFLKALAGDFAPLAISLDERGQIYLMVQSGGKVALWLLTQAAERLWTFSVPPECVRLLIPPVIGYDHSVYLVSEGAIVSLGPDGKLRWQRSTAGHCAGAIVTADDRLVTSEGSQLAAWDAEGKRQVLFDCGEKLATPPVLTPAGDLIVASDAHMFCIARPQ